MAPFDEMSPIYTITLFPHRYSLDRYFLRRRTSVDRRIRGYMPKGGIPGHSPQVLVSPARVPDQRLFRPGHQASSSGAGPASGPASAGRSGQALQGNVPGPGRTGTCLWAYRLKSSREISGEDTMNRSAARSTAASRSSHAGVMRMRSTRRIRTWATSPTM